MSGLQAIRSISGTAVPLAGDDIDTDQIMPSRFLRWITFAGLEKHVFEDQRRVGSHPFDNPAYADAAILIAERNFGCGSSREHAPQGLRRGGIRTIVAESFGEIFAANCTAIGLVCVTLARADRKWLSTLCGNRPGEAVTVDLMQRRVEAGGRGFACKLPEGRRQQLVKRRTVFHRLSAGSA